MFFCNVNIILHVRYVISADFRARSGFIVYAIIPHVLYVTISRVRLRLDDINTLN